MSPSAGSTISVPLGSGSPADRVSSEPELTRASTWPDTVRHQGQSAFYDRKDDVIVLPPRERFTGTPTSLPLESYYATLLHELTHWTGAAHRLDREFGRKFGDSAYAMEELVADLGSAFLCADLAVACEPRPDHAAYLQLWLTLLKQDARIIFTTARLANRASDYLHEKAAGVTAPT